MNSQRNQPPERNGLNVRLRPPRLQKLPLQKPLLRKLLQKRLLLRKLLQKRLLLRKLLLRKLLQKRRPDLAACKCQKKAVSVQSLSYADV